jgi:hypothetical protein
MRLRACDSCALRLRVCGFAHAALALRQSRNLGFSSAVAAQQLDAAALRMAAVAADVDAVRAALAPRPEAASAAARQSPEFSSLPHAMAQRIFKKLPVDLRARAALVCRSWRDLIAEPTVWTSVNLSPHSGISIDATDAVLRGATARAQGQLTFLMLYAGRISVDTLVEVLTSQQSIHELYWRNDPFSHSFPSFLHVEQVARALPQLPLFNIDVRVSSVVDAARMLRNESPFQALRVRALCIDGRPVETSDAAVLSLVAAISQHKKLDTLLINDVSLRTTAVIDAFAAAVTECGLRDLRISDGGLSPASQPTLLRLLRARKLQVLSIKNNGEALFDAAGAAQIADALGQHHKLQYLELTHALLWNDPTVAAVVMRAATRHPSLHALRFNADAPLDQAAAGIALCVLCASDSPKLRMLDIDHVILGDAGMRPLLGALAFTRYLRTLDCCNVGMSEEFARDVFLPAIRANTSLRKLTASRAWGGVANGVAPPAVLEAEALVAARRN